MVGDVVWCLDVRGYQLLSVNQGQATHCVLSSLARWCGRPQCVMAVYFGYRCQRNLGVGVGDGWGGGEQGGGGEGDENLITW